MPTLAESYSDVTRIALTLACYAADGTSEKVIAPAHVLGGLLREPSQEARALLVRAGARSEDVTDLAERLLPAHVLDRAELRELRPYARSTKLVMMQAPEEARLDGVVAATPKHHLRALFAAESRAAVGMLQALGVSRDKLHAASIPDTA